MLKRMIGSWIGIALAGAGVLQAARLHPATSPAASRQAVSPQPQRALLDRYCVTCHNERSKIAGLMLDTVDLEHVSKDAEIWEKVLRKVRAEAMPPPGAPRPDRAAYLSLRTYLETSLDRAAAAHPNPGRPGVHRLNRAEYGNAIRDLLALELDSRTILPADDSSYGFDNIADVLSISPALLERYLSAAGTIARRAVGSPAIGAMAETYKVPVVLLQEDRMSEQLPFGSRGGIAIRHHFPLDAEYVLRIRLQRALGVDIRGVTVPNQIEVRLDRARLKLFTVGGKFKPKPMETGAGTPSADAAERLEYARTADADLEVRFPAKAGTRLVGVSFVKEPSAPEGLLQVRPSVASFDYTLDRAKNTDMAVDTVEITGPYKAAGVGETASRRRIFACRPTRSQDELACAEKILTTLARRAYRRPVTEDDVQILLNFYKAGRTTRGFDGGIELALKRLLVDPSFLVRVERDPANQAPGSAYRITDVELASRLSFFLWSSIPDDQLLDLAVRGRLRDPVVLDDQVRRMLADPRSNALVANFGGQWFYLRNVRAVAPDPETFPDFDDTLREAFQRETELFFEDQLREDRSVLDLLRANYTFVNERLARHYGIPKIYGSHFRRVTLSDDHRAGLLGHGSILTVTSHATRTSPVVRGKWLLENILGAPPPPPPPDVPALKENNEGLGKVLSVRERMEQHRKSPACASCHARMDPLGFALDNFDAIGRWRTTDGDSPIDASGALPDGTRFQGPAELRALLLSRGEEFVTVVTEKLLTYAVGRGVEYYDAPEIRAITREAALSDHRWSSLILGIIKSKPFQMRMLHGLSPASTPSQVRKMQ